MQVDIFIPNMKSVFSLPEPCFFILVLVWLIPLVSMKTLFGHNLLTGDVRIARDAPISSSLQSTQCNYPCDCEQKENVRCQAGIETIKDGCNCCYICARQQGDLCDYEHKCDKGLFCDFILDDGVRGVCRAKPAQFCEYDGKRHKDGEQFKLSCNTLCSCQNGDVSCTTLCPQEERPPSTIHCKEPLLVKIGDRCCREWVCPHSHSRPGPDEFPTSSDPETLPGLPCKKEVTEWSPCTVTCGMGVSMRVTNDNDRCEPVNEQRLCMVRPCGMKDSHLHGHDCKNTWRDGSIKIEHDGCRSIKDYNPKYCSTCKRHRCCNPDKVEDRKMEFYCDDDTYTGQACKSTWKYEEPIKLKYGECSSLIEYRLKYCSTCKRRKCCGPGRTKTLPIQFQCPDGKEVSEPFMWIKNCECHKRRRCPFN